MAYPNGSGSEILRRGAIHNLVTADTTFKFDGTSPTTGTSSYVVPTDHIITLLNVIIADQSNAAHQFQMIAISGGVNINLVYQCDVPPFGTYVWDERMILHTGDKILIAGNASSNFDVFYSYIDQNWE